MTSPKSHLLPKQARSLMAQIAVETGRSSPKYHPLPEEARSLMARIAVETGMSLEQRNTPSYGSGAAHNDTVEMLVLQYPPESAPSCHGPAPLGETVRICVSMVAFRDKRMRYHATLQSQSAYERNVGRGNTTHGSTKPEDMIEDASIAITVPQLKRFLGAMLRAEKASSLQFVGNRLSDEMLTDAPDLAVMPPEAIAKVITRRVGYYHS